jgi:hypothetical protein
VDLPNLTRMHLRALALLALTAACGGQPVLDAKAGEKPLEITGGISEGERELTLGNPGLAAKILERIPADDSSYAYAQQLLGVAKEEIESIARHWLADIDLLIATQQYTEALARCRFLVAELPLAAEARDEVEKRQKEIEEARQDAEVMLEDTASVARDYLLANDHEAALRALRSARSLVWELDRDRALVWERIISAADLRLEKAEGGKKKARRTAALGQPPPPAKGKRKGKGADAEPAIPDQGALGSAAAEPAVASEQLNAGSLMRQADGHRDRKDFFRAIQTYHAVLKVERGHPGATAALKELEPQRQALIKEYMDKAQEHFLRQNLAAAAPYYKRVLALEPGHEGASEGLKMHENLERIRRESGK